jgi:hypothetical protein
MNRLTELEAAADALPTQDKRVLVQFLLSRLKDEDVGAADLHSPGHGVLDIERLSLGPLLTPFGREDDLLSEMLEGRR